MPAGWLKVAAVPVPSTALPLLSAPPAPEPASVVTSRLAMTTARMRLLFVSATNILAPSAERHSAAGALKALLVPLPSAHAASPDPANVVVAPFAVATDRILLLAESAT